MERRMVRPREAYIHAIRIPEIGEGRADLENEMTLRTGVLTRIVDTAGGLVVVSGERAYVTTHTKDSPWWMVWDPKTRRLEVMPEEAFKRRYET